MSTDLFTSRVQNKRSRLCIGHHLSCKLWFQMAENYQDVHDIEEPLLRDAVQEAEIIEKKAVWFYRDFTGLTPRKGTKLSLDFLGRDNVLEVALGLVIGGAFSGVVTSLVSDIILPPISLITQSSKNLANYFLVLRPGETPHAIYNTVEQAAEDGKDYIFFVQLNCDRSDIHGLGTFCAEGSF